MLPLWVVVVLALASFRATRLVTKDSITLPFRERLYRFAWQDQPGRQEPEARAAWRTYVYEGLTCPWCLGVWVSTAGYCAWRWGSGIGRGVVVVLAIAGGQALLAANGDRDE